MATSLRNTFMNKIPTVEDIEHTCNALASKLIGDEASRTEAKLALVDVLDEALNGNCILHPTYSSLKLTQPFANVFQMW